MSDSPMHAPLDELLGSVRSMLRTSPPFIPSDSRPLIDQALSLLAREDMDSLEGQRYTSDLAHTISTIIENTQDQSTVSSGFGLLLELGPVGEHLAGRYLHKGKVRAEALGAFLSNYEPNQQLILLDQFFRSPRKVEPWFLQWAFDLAKIYQSEDPEEALLYLEKLDERRQEPALPMQRELLKGRFGIWLGQLLKMDLDETQIAYMGKTAGRLRSASLAADLLRRAGELRSESLIAVLEAVGRTGRRGDQKLVRQLALFLKQPHPAVKLAALDCLLALGARQAVTAAGFLHTRFPAMRPQVNPRLMRCSAREFSQYIKSLPATDHAQTLAFLLVMVHRAMPEWMDHGVKAAARASKEQTGSHVVTALQQYLEAFAPLARKPEYEPPKASLAVSRKTETKEGGGFLTQVKKAMGVHEEAPEGAVHALTKLQSGQNVQEKTYQNGALPGCSFKRNRFVKVALVNLDLSRSAMQGVHFTGCKLSNVEFTGSVLESVVFEKCVLTNCRFNGAALKRVRFDHCKLTAAHFAGTRAEHLRCADSQFYENDFWGASLIHWEVERCGFTSANFSHCAMRQWQCHGAAFEDARFEKAFIHSSSVTSARFTGVACSDLRVHLLDSDSPAMLQAEHESLFDQLETAAQGVKATGLPSELGAAEGVRFMYKLLSLWFSEKEAAARRRVFLARNADRLAWTMWKLGEQAAFLKMLPALIESPVTPGVSRGESYVFPSVQCIISGYAPNHETVMLLEEHLGADNVDWSAKRSGLPIEAVYSIGSTGAIAQTRTSDLDLWVCYERERIPDDKLNELQDKLSALEDWADTAFNLETHFFLMDLDKIRANDFGFSSQESAGSAQAKLLKEEFYRTAMLLAGKIPAWHCLPTALSEKAYVKQLHTVVRSPMIRSAQAAQLVDLGHLGDIPPEEFFGACLWQIVKALKSPFKSIMKLALMDRYVHNPENRDLLCDRIKERLYRGEADVWDVDPYAALFRELYEHYEATERKDERDLMELAFVQKTGFDPLSRTTGRRTEMRGDSYVEYFFPYSESPMEKNLTPAVADPDGVRRHGRDLPGFAELMALSERLSRFMFSTYAGIQKQLAGKQYDIAITGDDMTKLGRKIFSTFQEAPNKIKRIQLLTSRKEVFSALQFSCEGVQGASVAWVAEGEMTKGGGKKGRTVEEAARDVNPVRLFAWLAVNGLYYANMPLRGSSTLQSPVSMPDVTDMLEALREFFPASKVFDADIDAGLEREQVVRVFIAANFTAPREAKKAQRATLVYASSWGELFCEDVTNRLDVLELSLRDFAALSLQQLGREMDPHARVKSWLPAKSQCNLAPV